MNILFKDETIIVVDKPAGLLTIRDGYNPELPSVKSILEENHSRCWIVHRLDKETSGVLLIARNEAAHRQLNIAFQNHQIKKIYHALVMGILQEQNFIIAQPLKINGDRKHRTVPDADGKPATTQVSLIKNFSDAAIVSIEPQSGYTHQIRAHLSSIGHPILGDALYQTKSQFSKDINKLIDRTALHAFQLSFNHPLSNEQVTIKCNYPPDFENALHQLT